MVKKFVSAKDGWQDMGIHLERGQGAHIVATGQWTTHPDRVQSNDANGLPIPAPSSYVFPGKNIGGLVAMVRNPGVSSNAEFVGANGHIVARDPGTLYLCCNDENGDKDANIGKGFHDNDGSLQVEITT